MGTKLNTPWCVYDNNGFCFAQKNTPRCDCDTPGDCDILGKNAKLANYTKSEMVNHPQHYNAGGIECIDGLAAATKGLEGIEAFCTANAIKYLWRWKWKNGIEDLDKAIWYIEYLKKHLVKND